MSLRGGLILTTLAPARTICLANRGEQSPHSLEIASPLVALGLAMT